MNSTARTCRLVRHKGSINVDRADLLLLFIFRNLHAQDTIGVLGVNGIQASSFGQADGTAHKGLGALRPMPLVVTGAFVFLQKCIRL